MSDSVTTIDELKGLVKGFSVERDWEQFHHPKELAVALVIEIGELLEHFRYLPNEEIDNRLQKQETQAAVADELADCFWLMLRLADVLDVDLSSALRDKVARAHVKYPIDQSRGRPDKYTAYQNTRTETDDS